MQLLLKMAWRNLWRNKVRTLLTASVAFISVFLSILITSLQYGMYDKMISNTIDRTGHLQIQEWSYGKTKSINQCISLDSGLLIQLKKTEHVQHITSHLESFALASFGEMTKGVMVLGMVPSEEENFSRFKNKFTKMNFPSEMTFNDNDKGVLLGEKLASLLNIQINDTLALISQGYHGASASGLFPVRGTLRFPMAEIESRIILMTLPTVQQFYAASGLCTSILIKADDNRNLDQIRNGINPILNKEFCIRSWEELSPEIVQMIDSDIAAGYFVKGTFYMILCFMIFSTMAMTMFEREKEFGMIIAIGMGKAKLSLVILSEILFISLIGTITGLGTGYGVSHLLNNHPIPLYGEMARTMKEYGFEPMFFFSVSPDIYYWQPLVVLFLILVIFIFPLMMLKRLDIIVAIRN